MPIPSRCGGCNREVYVEYRRVAWDHSMMPPDRHKLRTAIVGFDYRRLLNRRWIPVCFAVMGAVFATHLAIAGVNEFERAGGMPGVFVAALLLFLALWSALGATGFIILAFAKKPKQLRLHWYVLIQLAVAALLIGIPGVFAIGTWLERL